MPFKVVVIGSGAREHALVRALLRGALRSGPREVVAIPGNAGIGEEARCVPAAGSAEALAAAALWEKPDLVVVGPEAPLAEGLADRLAHESVPCFGPTAAAARIEASKAFAKDVMARAGVPTAQAAVFDDPEKAKAYARGACVVKLDGLAAGKGVIVCDDAAGARRAIDELWMTAAQGGGPVRLLVEERLEGPELSVIALTDGSAVLPLAPARDHKRLEDGDRGPNTGGMGAVSPPRDATPAVIDEVVRTVLQPTVRELAARPGVQLPPGRPRGAGHPAAAAQRSAPAAPRQRAGRARRPGALVGSAHRRGGGDRRLRVSGHAARRRRGGRPARGAAVRRSLDPARGDQGEGGQGGDRGRAPAHRRGPGRGSGRGARARLPGRRAHPDRRVPDAPRHRRRGGGVSEARAELPVPEPERLAARRGSPGGARPFGQLDRLLSLKFLQLFAATLGGVVLLYLTVDFADRAGSFWGRAWGKAALELYWNKAAVVAYQLAPAALIIAAALLATLLARRGELTALFALGVRPWRLAAPVAAVTAVLGVLLFLLGERVVVYADARAEEIQVKRFNRWGDWATYHAGASWLRGENGRIYHLGSRRDGGWEPATVLEIAPPFRLSRRIDARRLEPAGPGRWRFLDAVETRYALSAEPGGIVGEVRADVLEESFPESAAALELRSGRPRQLSWK